MEIIRKVMFICFLLLNTYVLRSQFLLIPSDYFVKPNSEKLLNNNVLNKMLISEDISLQPSTNVFSERRFPELDEHYLEIMTEELDKVLLEIYPEMVEFDYDKSPVNLEQIQNSIFAETTVYHALKTKPLFGYGGRKPVAGENTKKFTNQLQTTFNIDYIVFASVISIKSETTKVPQDVDEYKGWSILYAWIIDAESGEILKEITVKGPKRPNFSKYSNESYVKVYSKINDKKVVQTFRKGVKKISKKMDRF